MSLTVLPCFQSLIPTSRPKPLSLSEDLLLGLEGLQQDEGPIVDSGPLAPYSYGEAENPHTYIPRNPKTLHSSGAGGVEGVPQDCMDLLASLVHPAHQSDSV